MKISLLYLACIKSFPIKDIQLVTYLYKIHTHTYKYHEIKQKSMLKAASDVSTLLNLVRVSDIIGYFRAKLMNGKCKCVCMLDNTLHLQNGFRPSNQIGFGKYQRTIAATPIAIAANATP